MDSLNRTALRNSIIEDILNSETPISQIEEWCKKSEYFEKSYRSVINTRKNLDTYKLYLAHEKVTEVAKENEFVSIVLSVAKYLPTADEIKEKLQAILEEVGVFFFPDDEMQLIPAGANTRGEENQPEAILNYSDLDDLFQKLLLIWQKAEADNVGIEIQIELMVGIKRNYISYRNRIKGDLPVNPFNIAHLNDLILNAKSVKITKVFFTEL